MSNNNIHHSTHTHIPPSSTNNINGDMEDYVPMIDIGTGYNIFSDSENLIRGRRSVTASPNGSPYTSPKDIDNEEKCPPKNPFSPRLPTLSLDKARTSHLSKIVLVVILSITIVTVVVLFVIPGSPAQKILIQFMEWLKGIPTIGGAFLLSFLYAIALVLCLPGTPFNLAAGFLFGISVGSVVNIIGCDLGACISFFIGRGLGRDWAQQKILTNQKYELIDKAVERNAFLIIFLIRLSPVLPFGICNYLFGITTVSFPLYWAATTLGLIPCTVAYTYLGSLMRNLTDIYSENGEQKEQQTYMIIAAVFMTVLGIIVITLVTKRTLDKTMDERKREADLESGILENENADENNNGDIEMGEVERGAIIQYDVHSK
eukprot:TRINITY_DN3627_c0_g2_i1.p1 TRINITY_DN3627_c0_g2~~TRINITY_DN3627_c0_g2_i1.p1  ORF type:complete len:374 (-),score=55.34 TRINITY_DN3627_c0_g2_i1:48-1169(-)